MSITDQLEEERPDKDEYPAPTREMRMEAALSEIVMYCDEAENDLDINQVEIADIKYAMKSNGLEDLL